MRLDSNDLSIVPREQRTRSGAKVKVAQPDSARPNILFVMCDQLSAFACSAYGNQDVRTPHLQRLAEDGVVFQRAYCNAPLCAPSRASMMTGCLPSAIGVNDNGEELPSSVPTFVHQLRLSGYKTVLSGKMHFIGPDQLHGFEERLTTDIYPADYTWVEYWPDLGVPPRDPQRAEFKRDMANMVLDSGPVKWSLQLDYDEEVHHRALERIRQFARRRGDEESQPWFLCVSYTQPHDPYAPSMDYWSRYEGVEIETPEAGAAIDARHPWDEWANSYHGVDQVRPTRADLHRMRRAYYSMISYIDDKLGELRAELERLDLSDRTIVIFTSDHGDMAGEHGMFFKRTFREWATRIPLIVTWPGLGGGRVIRGNVSLVDVYPTLLEMAGLRLRDLPCTDELAGSSMVPTLLGKEDPYKEPRMTIIDYNGEGTIKPTRTVIRGHYKYVYVHQWPELLFDLARDPKECQNLAGNDGLSKVVAEIRSACLSDWDPSATERAVLASQKRRLFLDRALRTGCYSGWDFTPDLDGPQRYIRRDALRETARSSINQWDPLAGGR